MKSSPSLTYQLTNPSRRVRVNQRASKLRSREDVGL